MHTRRRLPKDVNSPAESVEKPITPKSLRSTELGDHNAYVFPNATPDESGFSMPESESLPVPHTSIQTSDLDFDLIWPDSEDLFQSLMSTEVANQWQIPLGTIPFSASPAASAADLSFGSPSCFDQRPASIGAIPSGGNHQAVQDVSTMISNLVSVDSQFRLKVPPY